VSVTFVDGVKLPKSEMM